MSGGRVYFRDKEALDYYVWPVRGGQGGSLGHLRNLADEKCVLFGGAISKIVDSDDPDYNPDYAINFQNCFNMATLGNLHKANHSLNESGTWKGEDEVDFTGANKIVNWCMLNNIIVKYHCMFWGSEQGVPDWLRNIVIESSDKKKTIETISKKYIKAILAEYQGKIKYFDVLNEWRHDCAFWRVNYGENFYKDVFKWVAQEVLNEKKYDFDEIFLIYNDYNLAGSEEGTTAVDDIIAIKESLKTAKLLQEKIKLGLGFQSHFQEKGFNLRMNDDGTDLSSDLKIQLSEQFKRLRENDIYIFISEFDTTDGDPPEYETGCDTSGGYDQYYLYGKYLEFCLKEGVRAFQMWDFWDGDSWRCNTGLFGANWGTKRSYQGFYDALSAYDAGCCCTFWTDWVSEMYYSNSDGTKGGDLECTGHCKHSIDGTDRILKLQTTIEQSEETWERIKVRSKNTYKQGVYEWDVYVPPLTDWEATASTGIGAFIYSPQSDPDDRHKSREIDFEIGYGLQTKRTEYNIPDEKLMCYMTVQEDQTTKTGKSDFPAIAIDPGSWYTFKIILKAVPCINGEGICYQVDWKYKKADWTSFKSATNRCYPCGYGPDGPYPTEFYIYCSVENYPDHWLGKIDPQKNFSAQFKKPTFSSNSFDALLPGVYLLLLNDKR